jgi:biopolymer transport protein ExbB
MKILRMTTLVLALVLFKTLSAETTASLKPAISKPHGLQSFDITKVYASSPVIYSILLLMSTSAIVIWLYTQSTFRSKGLMPRDFMNDLRTALQEKRFDEAKALCQSQDNLLAAIVHAGLLTRNMGTQIMIDAMKSEGKRLAARFWQRLSMLNDIAIIAPMLGLLGTVIGMFYAFYDVNRSVDTINAVFDGLGISVGTTVVGLIVAILSMILATTLKYRLIRNLSIVENEALSLSIQIETSGSSYNPL